MIAPDVTEAIAEIRRSFPNHEVDLAEDGQGGARVTVHGFALGEQYSPSTSWIGFTIGFQYPAADVYPHFVRGDLARRDEKPLGEAMTTGHTWNGAAAVQVSRRSKRWDRGADTAAIKLTKVLEWLRSR